ncbi:MAG: carbonic anhydrase, partial [Deltaproteobacteria bacterium]|nr:carbonic anhydrase [Deltaproteobacteria bacterium]
MKKLLQGIVDFRKNTLPTYRDTFAKLALGQRPDSFFVACSDSRVVPNLFASSDPGDLFVVRNVGNLIPACDAQNPASPRGSAVAALEFSVKQLGVRDIIICGHSQCGAMHALLNAPSGDDAPHLQDWLRHGAATVERYRAGKAVDASLTPENQLSQLNVLVQMEHVATYPFVRERISRGELMIHGWWFDIEHADVYAYEPEDSRFLLVEEGEAE